MNILERANLFATRIHATQLYGGEPYINHCLRVSALTMGDLDLRVAAILHDSIEDGFDTQTVGVHQIEIRFGERIAQLVLNVTRNPQETYFDFIRRVRSSESAPIKVADLTDHLNHESTLSESKIERYTKALAILTEK